MRRWLAALALVPAVALGSGCYSVENRAYYLDYARTVIELRDDGVSESQMLSAAMGGEASPYLRASMLEAISIAYTRPGAGPSLIAQRMQQACHAEVERTTRQTPPR